MGVEDDILSLRKRIEKLTSKSSSSTADVSEEAATLLAALAGIPDMNEQLLRVTNIAFAVDKLRKSAAVTDDKVKRSAKELLKQWQQVVSAKSAGEPKKDKKKVPKESTGTKAVVGGGSVERDAPIDFEITAAPPKRNKKGKRYNVTWKD
jgi:MoxR-like ATPase